jgi:hypothetical protein
MEAGRVHEFASVIWLMRRLPGEALALSRSFKALFRRWCRALPRTEMQYTSSRQHTSAYVSRCSTRVRVGGMVLTLWLTRRLR